jgi:hypothetical protein
MKLTAACVVTLIFSASVVRAQTPAAQKVGLVQYVKASYAGIKRDLVAAAERMPEADYGYKPSEMNDVRTYAAVIAHAADGMFGTCARVKGVPNPQPDVEKKLTRKPDIVKALAESFAFCDEAFSSLTDRSAEEYVRQGPVEIPKIAALMGALAHNAEMYGISSVYLRAKNLVPPGSDRR